MIGAGPLVSMRDVTKQFPGVVALDHVNFELVSGEIHALLGENGAGKSTLIKIISGVYPPTSGEVYIRGTLMHSFTPSSARGLGVGTVYQGLSLVPSLTVTQNLFLGHEQASHPMGWLDRPRMRVRAREALHDIGLDVDPDLNVERLSISQQQLVEIAKVLLLGVEILIMDEPTDKLTAREAGRLFALLRTMRQAGRGVIYITHKLEEIMQIADRVTVLRDGHKVATVPAGQTSFPHLIQMMVGRDIREVFPKKIVPLGGELLRVEYLSVPGILEDVSLSVRAGEIVGMAGIVGSGRTEFAKAIVGALPMSRGELHLFGRPVRISSPDVAVRSGLSSELPGCRYISLPASCVRLPHCANRRHDEHGAQHCQHPDASPGGRKLGSSTRGRSWSPSRVRRSWRRSPGVRGPATSAPCPTRRCAGCSRPRMP